jgi:hypothetical protein
MVWSSVFLSTSRHRLWSWRHGHDLLIPSARIVPLEKNVSTSNNMRDPTPFSRRKVEENEKQEQYQPRPFQIPCPLPVIHPRICSCTATLLMFYDIVKAVQRPVGVVFREGDGGCATIASS